MQRRKKDGRKREGREADQEDEGQGQGEAGTSAHTPALPGKLQKHDYDESSKALVLLGVIWREPATMEGKGGQEE